MDEKAKKIINIKVLSYHKTYVYFADRFNLQLAGELEEKTGHPPRQTPGWNRRTNYGNIKVILNEIIIQRKRQSILPAKQVQKF